MKENVKQLILLKPFSNFLMICSPLNCCGRKRSSTLWHSPTVYLHQWKCQHQWKRSHGERPEAFPYIEWVEKPDLMQLGFMIFVKYHIFIEKGTFCEWLMATINHPLCFLGVGAKWCKSRDGCNSRTDFWVLSKKVPHRSSASSGSRIRLKTMYKLVMESTKKKRDTLWGDHGLFQKKICI